MDRSWINSRRFSKEHQAGVKEFMTFVSERFTGDEQILCPCRHCLNRVHGPKGQVEDHLYIHGMASTYTRWIHHGEALEVVPHENEGHVDEHASLIEDFVMNVDVEDDPDDGICGLVQELYNGEDEGKGKESMFAILLEEMKQELYPNAECSRFSFVVKLLHIKSFYRIPNVAFTAILKLLSSSSKNCSIPESYEEAKRLIRALGLGTHNGESIDFYGCLKNIIELKYYSESSDRRTVILFQCDWFDTHGKKFKMKDDGISRSINHGSLWYKDDPFIFATMAAKVFYLEDNKYGENWMMSVQVFRLHLTNEVWKMNSR